MSWQTKALVLIVLGTLMAAGISNAMGYDKAAVIRLEEKFRSGQSLTAEELIEARRLAEAGAPIDAAAMAGGSPNPAQDRGRRNPLDEYSWVETDYEWVDISANGTNTGLTGDDQNLGPFALGFTVSYFGQDYTSLRVCSNGFASFTSTAATFTNQSIPNANEPNNSLFGLWDDLFLPNGGQVLYYADDANDRFIVSWLDVPHIDGNGNYTFQIIINASGSIVYNYMSLADVGSITVGIENQGGTEGLQVCFDGTGTLPTNESAFLISEQDGIPAQVTNLVGSVNGTTVTLSWLDPTQDTNGNPITLTNVQVWRGLPGQGQLIATVNPGVQTAVHTNAPTGEADYYVRAYANPFYGSARSVHVVVGDASYVEGFDQGDGLWVAGGDADGFEWGIPLDGPNALSEPNVWGVDLDDFYEDNQHAYVDLDIGLTVVSTDASFDCWIWYAAENSWDGCNFKVSIDGGNTWEIVTPTEGYPWASIQADNQWIGGEPAWTGTSNSWLQVHLPIGVYVGEAPIFRFDFGADPIISGYAGFYFDNVVIWGLQEPVTATVSGTVTLDGGNGNITQVQVRSNGIGNPITNPNAQGQYTLQNVLVGERTITALLNGYQTTSIIVTVPEGGINNVNLLVPRNPPPAPTLTSASVNGETGVVTLSWTLVADPLVDEYWVMRKMREDDDWVHVQTYTGNSGTDQLTLSGIWQYAIRAVDTGASQPIQSANSNHEEVLYGEIPPTGLHANGNFDDHIHLFWLPPGVSPAFQIFYDDSSAEAWYSVQGLAPSGPQDYFAVRFTPPSIDSVDYPLPVQTANIYFQMSDPPLAQVLVCPDGGGFPDLDNAWISFVDLAADSSPGWLHAPVDGAVLLEDDSDFWVAWQFAPGLIGPLTGSDATQVDGRSYWTLAPPQWNQWNFHDWMCRVWVGGAGGAAAQGRGFVLSTGTASGYRIDQVPTGGTITSMTLSKNGADEAEVAMAGPVRSAVTNVAGDFSDIIGNPGRSIPSNPYSGAPMLSYRADNRNTLDDLVNYRVYRDGVMIAQPVESEYDDFVNEGITYSYYVTGWYDSNEESGPTGTIDATAAMAPAAPANVNGVTLNSTQIRIEWINPTVNANGQPLIDFAGCRIFRDGVQIGEVGVGVQQYVDTPPLPNRTYLWEVRGFDEVPNVGPAGSFAGSVIDPWAEDSYDWIDISQDGINTGLTFDDQNNGPFNIGFPFTFYGNTYTSIRVCSNGWISFTDVSTTYFNQPIPSTFAPNNAIYGIWDDLFLPTGGQILYRADPGQFIVSWLDVPHIDGQGIFTFQIILDESGGIKINYQTVDHAMSWTTGVENLAGTQAIQLCHDGVGDWCATSESAVSFWGAPPVYANVSGHVTLDGGAGNLTQVAVSANGVSHPTTNPDAQGDYTLTDVVVGNRRLIASLTGYHSDTINVAVPEGGLIGQNFTLVRVDPPVPTGLTGSVNSGTGLVTLDWADSPDPLVDVYRIYRKLQTETQWVLVQTVSQSNATDQLTVDNVYNYAVSAVDNGVTTPVESDLSSSITILYGEIPPVQLTANGNFDDHIHLSWFEPGTPPESEMFYDNGANSPNIDGIGWWGGQPTFGWLVAKYSGNGEIAVTRLKTWITSFAMEGDPIQIGLFAADDSGLPTGDPLSVVDDVQTAPFDVFKEWDIDPPAIFPSGTFFVGMRQMTFNSICLGGDDTTPFINSTFYYAFTAGTWTSYEPGLPVIPMQRCFVIGDVGGVPMELELAPSPAGELSSVLSQRSPAKVDARGPVKVSLQKGAPVQMSWETLMNKYNADPRAAAMPNIKADFTAVNTQRMMERAEQATDVRVPYASTGGDDRDGRRGTLDDILYYIVYRNGVDIGHPVGLSYDDPRPENTPTDYYVTAYYDNNEESQPSNTVNDAVCNMAPGMPPSINLTPVGQSTMRVTWTAPTQNADGTPLVDLAGYRIYRDGAQVGTVGAGVTQYDDVPPVPNEFYLWSVRGIDEVPNVGPEASRVGAVQSPWEEIEYEWIDISQNGTALTLSDDSYSGNLNIGFTFNYYGQDYTQLKVGSNGYLTLDVNDPFCPYIETAIPSAATPNNALYYFWDDMNPGAGGQVLYRSDVAEGLFIVSYLNVPHFGSGETYTYQCILTENGGIIYNYQTVPINTSCTIGVENATGTEAIQLLFDGSGPFLPTDGSAVSFWGGPSGELAGTVIRQSDNEPLPDVAIYLVGQLDTAYTDASGDYSLGAEPGTYTVGFVHRGSCDTTVANIEIEDDQTTTQNMTMRSPSVTFSVTSISEATTPGVNVTTSFTMGNPTGYCDLDYLIADNAAWLTATPAQGSIVGGQSREITVLMNVQNLNPGQEYQATIRITHNAPGDTFLIPVTLFISLDADDPRLGVPTEFAFHSNYPNPFNATTEFRFDVPAEARVEITVLNLLGQEVATVVNGVYQAGRHQVSFEGSNLASGMYITRMKSGSYAAMGKMLLLK